ncbi:MAG TPA: AI-2E family transporter [Gemmataceae bacterium]|nr:AI-2E family transporter [Gemmataceae bacterium]
MADAPPDDVTAEAPSLATTARWMVILVGTLYLLRELGPILKPLFLAVLVGYIVLPVHLTVKKWVPGRLSLAASGVLSLMLILLVTIGLQTTVRILVDEMPELNSEALRLRQDAETYAQEHYPQTSESFSHVVFGEGESPVREFSNKLVNMAADTLSTAAVVGLYLVFLLLEAGRFPDRLRRAFSEQRAERIMLTIDGVNRGIAGYLGAKVKASVVLAVPVFVVLFVFSTPLAILWAVVTFFCNFIPYLGSLVGFGLPTLFVLVKFGFGWEWITIAILLLVIHTASASIIEPRIIGKAVGLSPVVILFALAFWGYCWGLTGMLLAVPLTVMLKIGAEHLDATRPIAKLVCDE